MSNYTYQNKKPNQKQKTKNTTNKQANEKKEKAGIALERRAGSLETKKPDSSPGFWLLLLDVLQTLGASPGSAQSLQGLGALAGF